jgi:hypothetical protein
MAKIGRRVESLSFRVRRLYRGIVTAKPSVFVIAATIAGLSIFFLGGGVYDILEKPLIAIPLGTQILFFYPGTINEQTILDSAFAMVTYFFGLLGLLLMYQSTKYAYRPRQAYMLLLIGVAFLVIAYFSIENLIVQKLTTSTSGG